MPRLTILLLSLMLGAGAAVLASCGGDDGPDGPGIPSADAEGMLAELERARAAFEAGDCVEVQESAQQIADNAANLADADPPLDPEIQDALTQGAEHLGELATTSSECAEEPTTTTTDDEKTHHHRADDHVRADDDRGDDHHHDDRGGAAPHRRRR